MKRSILPTKCTYLIFIETNSYIYIYKNIFIFSFRLFFDTEKLNYGRKVNEKINLIM